MSNESTPQTTKICIINQKGGTGKTTTAVHLAKALDRRKIKTLLIDNDPQGSVATYLQLEPGALTKYLESSDSNLFQKAGDFLSILTSDASLLEVESRLHQNRDLISQLYRRDELFSPFHTVVFDMAPSRSLTNEAALFVADEVLIPVSCDYLALVGVRDILEFIDRINHQRGSEIKIKGILPTLFDSRSRVSKEAIQILNEHFPGKVFPPIHQSTKVKEAPSFGKTLFDYAPQNRATLDYEWLGNLLAR